MKLVLDKKHGNRIEFLASGITPAFANMLRRYSMSMVPVLAIENVTFYDNNSVFWDEYLAHRIGLMPVTTSEDTPLDTEVILSLDAEGPKTAYSSDMKSTDVDISVSKSIPIAVLSEGQHLRFEGKAVMGTGKKHAKFQAGLMSYGEEGEGFRMIVESFYHMEPKDVLKRGCGVIISEIGEIEAALGGKPKKAAKKTVKKAATKKPAAKKTTKKASKKKD